jgi:methionyl-tRNA formyltransferase
MLNLVFMGTPAFAVPVLESLAKAHRVSLVVTQPDKPKGRGQKLAAPPVKDAARALGIPVAQPESLKRPTSSWSSPFASCPRRCFRSRAWAR